MLKCYSWELYSGRVEAVLLARGTVPSIRWAYAAVIQAEQQAMRDEKVRGVKLDEALKRMANRYFQIVSDEGVIASGPCSYLPVDSSKLTEFLTTALKGGSDAHS